jgi:alkyldihydroxyacetonephosphate synthase
MEFSTLGGWINTRASGMKKNTYGNIEDIVQNITLCTSKGTYSKVTAWPRISNGPDLNQIIMGSEGNYGIVTECVLKIRPLPEVRIFDSIIFYDWESGVQFMHAVSKTKSWPTSIRLVDNAQFVFGTTLKPAHGKIKEFIERVKKFYVLNIKGFEADKLVACTLLFEGDKVDCEKKHAAILELAKKFHGMSAGAENGIRGYLLTFMVAYTRDLAADYQVAAESFETSCPWANVSQLC